MSLHCLLLFYLPKNKKSNIVTSFSIVLDLQTFCCKPQFTCSVWSCSLSSWPWGPGPSRWLRWAARSRGWGCTAAWSAGTRSRRSTAWSSAPAQRSASAPRAPPPGGPWAGPGYTEMMGLHLDQVQYSTVITSHDHHHLSFLSEPTPRNPRQNHS